MIRKFKKITTLETAQRERYKTVWLITIMKFFTILSSPANMPVRFLFVGKLHDWLMDAWYPNLSFELTPLTFLFVVSPNPPFTTKERKEENEFGTFFVEQLLRLMKKEDNLENWHDMNWTLRSVNVLEVQ